MSTSDETVIENTETLVKAQTDILKQIQRLHTNFKKTPKDRLCCSYIKTKIENLDEIWNTFLANHTEILHRVKDVTEYMETYDDTEDQYAFTKSIMLNKMSEISPTSSQNMIPTDSSAPSKGPAASAMEVKIPIMKIPCFDGQYTEWISFHDQFVSLIHNNASLSNVQKLHYLKMHVMGEAANLLKNVTITENNYEAAWYKLKRRYSNKRVIVNAYLQQLMSIRSLTQESAQSIKYLLDTTTDCLSGLENIGINTKTWDPFIIFLTISKLDSGSLERWEATVSKQEDLPSLEQLTDFLETRFRSLEGLQTTRPTTRYNNTISTMRTSRAYNTEQRSFHTTHNESCLYCRDEHYLFRCPQFTSLQYNEKKEFIEKNRLCYNCLTPNHIVSKCNNISRCHECGRRHHTLIHPEMSEETDKPANYREGKHETSQDNEKYESHSAEQSHREPEKYSNRVASHLATSLEEREQRTNTTILLATAIVKVQSESGRVLNLRALIDQGSEASFITEKATQALNLRREQVNSTISGVGDNTLTRIKHKVTVTIQSTQESTFKLNVNAFVLSKLTRLLPLHKIPSTWSHIQSLELADPSYCKPGNIDLLLGADVYSAIMMEGIIIGPPGSPLAQRTTLGWILSGNIQVPSQNNQVLRTFHITTHKESDLLQKFWELESVNLEKTTKYLTDDEQKCETIYKETHTRDEEGRYIVEIPVKDKDFDYGDTKMVAIQRLRSLERRLDRDNNLKEEYVKVLMEYKELNHMKEIDQEDTASNKFYLPHHAVIRQDKTTSRVRIVFDASCKGPNGRSLNDNMYVGPVVQQDLRQIVMRWRQHEICFVADCVKMYRQIKVTDESANLQRVLWTVNGELKEYKMTRVTFGTASAPYLATRTLIQLADDEEKTYPVASAITKTDFYMDDLLSGEDNIDDAIQTYKQMTGLMKRGGFPLQKWNSNSREFVEYIQREGHPSDETYVVKTDGITKTLGIRWQRGTDTFQYDTSSIENTTVTTKRTILREISKLFDPMGWLAPVIIVAKIFMQKLWLTGATWDEEVPKAIKDEWIIYRDELENVKNIVIERWLHSNKNDRSVELYGYCDASQMAYAAVVYMRVVKQDGTIHVSLIMSKTRVAPIKTVSIPRLELCGAVLLAKLIQEVARTLNVPQHKINAFTDSTIVLAWLQSHPSRWNTFIANRTSDILSILPSEHWHHVNSESNPADIASRGTSPSHLAENQLWWKGPEELRQDEIEYHQREIITTNLEERKLKTMTTTARAEFALLSKYSTLKKLLRVTAFILRVFSTKKPKMTILSGEEINKALSACVKVCQQERFYEEIARLKDSRPIKKDSKIGTFSPFLDEKGILRVGGRLQNAKLPYYTKHQIVLPENHPLTSLIINNCHEQTLHGGPTLMLSNLRRRYWIVHAKSLVRRAVHRCVKCVRYRATINTQMMGSLPEVRVTPSKPFLHSGIDFAGPIDIRLSKGRGCKTQKGYIALFICLVTRAIHIEIVTSLTAHDFVAAFKRFVARRGHCSDMWSDNGTNLVAGGKELQSMFNESMNGVSTKIRDILANDGTTWHHIPASAPHFGGLWEAGVKSVKFHLKRILGETTLTYEEMSTVTAQIEACLNSRPISPLSEDPNDLLPLTPGHFLLGEAPITVPDQNYLDSNINRLSRWQLTQNMVQDFWSRWCKEYLTRLQQRPKWINKQPNLAIGELVLLKEDNNPPAKWSMGRIVELHPGTDNLVRVISVKCKNAIVKRPIVKICRLPVD